VHMPLFNVRFPTNADMALSLMLSITEFDILPSADINSQVFEYEEEEDGIDARFKEFGYESVVIIKNLGSMFIYMVGIASVVVFLLLFKLLSLKYKM
jgi:hypothetical protein